jgi:hypothetical protein
MAYGGVTQEVMVNCGKLVTTSQQGTREKLKLCLWTQPGQRESRRRSRGQKGAFHHAGSRGQLETLLYYVKERVRKQRLFVLRGGKIASWTKKG